MVEYWPSYRVVVTPRGGGLNLQWKFTFFWTMRLCGGGGQALSRPMPRPNAWRCTARINVLPLTPEPVVPLNSLTLCEWEWMWRCLTMSIVRYSPDYAYKRPRDIPYTDTLATSAFNTTWLLKNTSWHYQTWFATLRSVQHAPLQLPT